MNNIRLALEFFKKELEGRKRAHSSYFSISRLTKSQNERIEGICREILGLSTEHKFDWTLLVRVFLNYAFPVNLSHIPLNMMQYKWNEFLQEEWSNEMRDTLGRVDNDIEKGVKELIKHWWGLSRSVWLKEQYVSAFQSGDVRQMTKFELGHIWAPSWYKFIRLYFFLTDEGEKFGLVGDLKRKLERAVFVQYYYLRTITNAITVNTLLTPKGRERFEKYASRGVNGVVASDSRSFARPENRELMSKTVGKMLGKASGRKPTKVQEILERL